MFKSKNMEDKFYEIVFLVFVEKTAEGSRNTKGHIGGWAEFTETNEELLQRTLFKLKKYQAILV